MPEPPQSSFRIGWTPGKRLVFVSSVLWRCGLGLAAMFVAAATLGCSSSSPNGTVIVKIPEGASFQEVLDSIVSGQVTNRRRTIHLYARLHDLDRSIKAGTYRIRRDVSIRELLDILTTGRVVTFPLTVPEGLTLAGMAPRIATATGSDSATIAAFLNDASLHAAWKVPGPGLEGYLFPDTYRFAERVGVETVIATMVDEYHRYWTPERRALLSSTGLTEREAVTLASIIQAEAVYTAEMPTISSVYHNRLRIGMWLQADPTVLYALGGHRQRLLYAAIDSVADNPYNTYRHGGLPPGPIGAPGSAALDAALAPEDTDYLYFVAVPGGEHIFSRTLAEHNNARIRAQRYTSPS